MFLDMMDWVKVVDFICGIIVLLGNDVCVVIVEMLLLDGIEVGFVC